VIRREILGQAADHPVDLLFPESEYLTGFLVEVA
jgi:23S rRNA G2069 N7-methylase RlmK/C1962 C5-methylase RlmI